MLSMSHTRFTSTESVSSILVVDTVSVSLDSLPSPILQVIITRLLSGQSIDEQATKAAARVKSRALITVLRISVFFLSDSRCGSVTNGLRGRQ